MTVSLLEAVPSATGTSGGPAPVDRAADGLTRLRRALGVVREPSSTADLIERLPTAVAALGFDRVVYAQLTGSRWQPVSFHGAVPLESDGWSRTLEPMTPEHEALAGRGPVVVNGGGPRGLLPRSWCRSYVAVAVVERGNVVGMIHAGRGSGAPTASEAELVSAFAEAVAACFASARALETVRELMAAVGRAAVELEPPSPIRPVSLRVAAVESSVTVREREVLELMAAGHTNAQIARRLVITEGTTKSHVKRIMRKLRAANRAEAVAAWMRHADRGAAPMDV